MFNLEQDQTILICPINVFQLIFPQLNIKIEIAKTAMEEKTVLRNRKGLTLR